MTCIREPHPASVLVQLIYATFKSTCVLISTAPYLVSAPVIIARLSTHYKHLAHSNRVILITMSKIRLFSACFCQKRNLLHDLSFNRRLNVMFCLHPSYRPSLVCDLLHIIHCGVTDGLCRKFHTAMGYHEFPDPDLCVVATLTLTRSRPTLVVNKRQNTVSFLSTAKLSYIFSACFSCSNLIQLCEWVIPVSNSH